MNYNAYIYVKDEGDFIRVIFQSPKALKIGHKQGLDKNKTKIDLPLESLNSIKRMDKDNSLSFYSEV